MTIEEAIRELKQFSGTTRLRLSANFWEALDRAIKSLEQEHCEDCPLVEIVTCKDCKYFERLTCLGGQCVCPTKTYINDTTNDFYCADAERRE